MGARVMVIGVGDVGGRLAAALAGDSLVDEIVLAGLSRGEGPHTAALLRSSYDAAVRFHALDATRQGDVERLLRQERPDLLVQAGSLLGTWALLNRHDPAARAISAAGLGLQLPVQIPILLAVMRAVKAVDLGCPVASISYPDVTHPMLHAQGLAPTIGLGNASIIHCRVRVALRARAEQGSPREQLPLLRVVGNFSQVYEVVACQPPSDPARHVRVYLGEDGRRADALAYEGEPLQPGGNFNLFTCAAAFPVLRALLPGAESLRYAAPAPLGLPGGYPVRIEAGQVALDLPSSVTVEELVAYHQHILRADGIERIADDGTVYYTETAKRAVADIDSGLAEPLTLDDALARFRRLRACLDA